MQTDKGVVLADALVEHLRRQSIILPALSTIVRASAEAITRANRRIQRTRCVATVTASMMRCCSTCSRSAGSTLT